MHPDDVVSAREFSELGAGLVERGWRVTAMPCNRDWRGREAPYAARASWQGVHFRRLWRPPGSQRTGRGRFFNSVWMCLAWCLVALRRRVRPDVVIVGTDPVMSVCTAWVWRLCQPKVRIAHWCFDVYPEAAVAHGILRERGLFARFLAHVAGKGYAACHLIADIGPCMRKRLERYGSQATRITLVPWALAEPDTPVPVDAEERRNLFEAAPLALLYSGSFGRAHVAEQTLRLAAALRQEGARLVFSVRGHEVERLRALAGDDALAPRFAAFAPLEVLPRRLGAADIHVVTLHPAWTGLVLPSKFFGALACGRPVLFEGDPGSGISQWIEEHQVGWVLTPERFDSVLAALRELASHPERLAALRTRCHAVYRRVFSRRATVAQWDVALRSLLAGTQRPSGSVA